MNNDISVIVNGFQETAPDSMTISDLIIRFKEGDVDLIVEHNGSFVYPSRYADTMLSPGDRVEFINPNFGG